MRYIQAKVTLTNNESKRMAANYYVDAETFTEAETKIAQELYTNEVKAMGFVNYDEASEGDKEYYFKVILYAHTLDEVTAKEKRQRYTMLCNGDSVEEVTQQINAIKNESDELVKVEKININGIIK